MKASFDTSWDVNKYRNEFELESQWLLKKKFMEAYKSKYDEDRLVSYAQIFINIHFLGCRYPEPVMELIDSLSQGITEKNSKWARQSFVAASTAVEDKVKARLNQTNQPTPANTGPISFVQSKNLISSLDEYSYPPNGARRTGDVWVRGQKRPTDASPSTSKKLRLDWDQPSGSYSIESRRHQANIQQVVDSGPFGKVVVLLRAFDLEENPICIIERASRACHMSSSFDFLRKENDVECKLSLDGLYLATGEGPNKQSAKESACKIAVERLKETSFTIIIKAPFIASESIDRQFSRETSSFPASNAPIADSNIGNKLLKLMGWEGGGLGKNQQGISEPIEATGNAIRRAGLGISSFFDFRKKMLKIIEDFARGDSKDDLVFSPEFSKEERKHIHELVCRYQLKSRSYGKEEMNTRRLVVFKKVRPLEIVEDLMNCGGETEKYKLVSPQSLSFN